MTKHYLPAKPMLCDWISSTVPEVGMLVWLELDGRPLDRPWLIGDINRRGTDGSDVVHSGLLVLAYARLSIDKLAALV